MMETILFFIQHFFFSFWAAFAFSIIFNMPKEELAICGISGAIGWTSLQTVLFFKPEATILSTFIGSILMTFFSRLMAFKRKKPITIYLISGGIPLVPGYGIYSTMRGLVDNEYQKAAIQGVETVKTAGVIVFGMILVFAIPWQAFKPVYAYKKRQKDKNRNPKDIKDFSDYDEEDIDNGNS